MAHGTEEVGAGMYSIPFPHNIIISLGACARVSVVVLSPLPRYILGSSYTSKVMRHTVSCRLLKIWVVWTSLKTFPSGDMALFACHDDRRLGSFSTKNTPIVLDTIRNGIVYEPPARSDDHLN